MKNQAFSQLDNIVRIKHEIAVIKKCLETGYSDEVVLDAEALQVLKKELEILERKLHGDWSVQ